MSNTSLSNATHEVIALTRSYRDSWIAVSDELDQLIARGGELPDLIPLLIPRQPDLGLDNDLDTPVTPAGLLASIDVIDATSTRYPRDLDIVDGRPLLLYVRGALPQTSRASVAIVGSREASAAARQAAFEIAAHVASAGHPVISGLAAGIDTAAHRGALSVNGPTVAVMGTGIDQVFPQNNTELAEQIARRGALVTQFAPGQGPSKTTFPARNAIIAGLADVSLLVQLSERSGTRIEADRTLEQGKPVWLWGPIMRGDEWANRFARHQLVSFVDSIDEVLERLDELGADGPR